jgi:cell division septation protein DedD
MKKFLFIAIILSLTIFSCKTKKAVTKDTPKPTPVEQVNTVKTDDAKDVAEPANDTPIMVKTEQVSVADNEDKSKEGFAFYVIIGSFSKPENAGKFREELKDKGFSPYLLNSETGFTRVAVGQSNSEKDARALVMKIRNEHSEHNDVWLLKKK